MRTEIVVLILGMALVTYIPRALPSLFVGKIKYGPKMEKFLKLLPYTAMAALIFPGIFSVDAANPIIGIVGGCVAIGLAFLKAPVIVSVIGAIAADMLLYAFMI